MAKLYCYDPRDKNQGLDDSSSWTATDNPVLIQAHSAMSLWGWLGDDFWDNVAIHANLADALADEF